MSLIEKRENKESPVDPPGDRQLCSHYVRRCFLECPDCLKFYPCRLCHNEENNHELNRFAVKNIKCSSCEQIQAVSNVCTNCKSSFGKYFCATCTMFDDRDRQQFHCDACGLCRVGGQKNFFHCTKCNMCLSKSLKDSHKCVENSSRANCAVCLEMMHTSTRSLQVPSCGHLLHSECYTMLVKHGDYRCPTCGKSTLEMSKHWKDLDKEIEETPMPSDFQDIWRWVLCKDCQAVTKAKFHVLGIKCVKCGSYNTCAAACPNNDANDES